MTEGWVKVDRSIQYTWIARKPEYVAIYMAIVWGVNYRPSTMVVGGQLITVGTGEMVTSIRALAERSNTTEKSVRNFLNHCFSADIIQVKRGTAATHLKLLSCNEIQPPQYEEGHSLGTVWAHLGQHHKKEERRKKKEERNNNVEEGTNSRSRPRSQDETTAYFAELGSTPEDAATFWDHFESNGWKVAGKAPMKNWQSAARNWVRRNKTNQRTLANGKATTGHRHLEAGSPDSIRRLFELERPGGGERTTAVELAQSNGRSFGIGPANENPGTRLELPFRRTDLDGL
jgi:hypothetical protein